MDDDYLQWLAGVRLRAARLGLELTHRGAGARTGVPFQTITRLETGKGAPTVEVLFKLVRGYGVPAQEIMFGPPAPAKASRNGSGKR